MRFRIRPAEAALLALAVLVLVFVGVTLQRFGTPVAEPGSALLSGPPQAGTGPAPVSLLQDVQGPPRVLVIGDDFAAGAGASSTSRGFARRLVAELDAPYVIDAQPNTGFVARGDEAGVDNSFPARARRIIQEDGPEPDLIVVEGGHEDFLASPGRLQDAAEQVARRLTDAYPDAQVVLMGTTRAVPENQVLVPLHDSIRAGAQAAGVPFIDPVAENWITADNTGELISGDLFHPNDAGHELWAERLLQDLRALPAA